MLNTAINAWVAQHFIVTATGNQMYFTTVLQSKIVKAAQLMLFKDPEYTAYTCVVNMGNNVTTHVLHTEPVTYRFLLHNNSIVLYSLNNDVFTVTHAKVAEDLLFCSGLQAEECKLLDIALAMQ